MRGHHSGALLLTVWYSTQQHHITPGCARSAGSQAPLWPSWVRICLFKRSPRGLGSYKLLLDLCQDLGIYSGGKSSQMTCSNTSQAAALKIDRDGRGTNWQKPAIIQVSEDGGRWPPASYGGGGERGQVLDVFLTGSRGRNQVSEEVSARDEILFTACFLLTPPPWYFL